MSADAGTITVRLFAGLEARSEAGRTRVDLPAAEAPTVAAAIVSVGLPGDVAALILVNGVHSAREASLAAGDELSLFPPLGGG